MDTAAQCGKCDKVACTANWECQNKECDGAACYDNAFYLNLLIGVILGVLACVMLSTGGVIWHRKRQERKEEIRKILYD